MSLILGKPSGGLYSHLFEIDGDGRSLCLRAPKTFTDGSMALSDVTCVNCKRLFDIMKRWNMTDDPEPIEITLPKKKRFKNPKAARVINTKSTKKRSGVRPRSKRSKKGA